jgi:hypothetical protein
VAIIDSTKILSLINSSGFPFQHSCASRIAALDGFEVAQEVPFTFPGSNGPLLGVHGTVDIVASHRATSDSDDIVCLVTETKKANEDIKKWIFFENDQKNPKWPLFVLDKNMGNTKAVMLTRTITLPKLGYTAQSNYQYCSNAIETNSQFSTINRNQTEKVYQSLKQVAHATRALLQIPKVIEGLNDLGKMDYNHLIFLPVVLTTAELYIPKYDKKLLIKGEIDQRDFDLGLPRKWLTYDLPLPDYLSYQIARPENSLITVEKLTVFIVNADSLEEFFEKSSDVRTIKDVPQRIM